MRNVRNISLVATCIAVAALAIGCPLALTTFRVVYPVTSQDFQIDASNRLVMTVRFSEDVDLTSLVAGTNVILDTENVTNASITIAAGTNAREIIVTSVDAYDNTGAPLLTFDPDGFFTLRLLGDGASPVLDTTGVALDGDKDGNPGGDFSHQYVLLG